MIFEGGFTFFNFLVDVFVIFLFVMWFWLLITVFADLFRRKDTSAVGKILWLIVLVVLPYLGVFAYLLTQSRNMAERSEADANKARENLREIVGFSVADEITKLDQLKASGSITAAEYSKLRAKLV